MKAMVYSQYGSPEVLHLKEIEKPIPGEDEILVKVKSTSVNRSDCAMLLAKPLIMRFGTGLFKHSNPILGTEFAGEIESIGKAVTTFRKGDRVFGFDDRGLSSYAEYLVSKEDLGLATIPNGITFEEAGACMEGAHYAYNFINKVDLQSGDKVLVNGASGGIGSAAVQLLKYYGAEITAVCATQSMELVKSLGASRVIDYTQEDFIRDQIKYDYVFDTVGKSSFGACKSLLNDGGVYISSELGKNSQNIFLSLASAIFGSLPGQSGKQVKFPYPPNIKRSVLLIRKLIGEGKFKPVIDRTYSMKEIPDAFNYVLTGQKIGNVAISV